MDRSSAIRLLVFVVLCTQLHIAPAVAEMKFDKPRVPIQLSIAPTTATIAAQKVAPGDVIEIAVSATAMTEISAMTIEATVHGGAELVSGPQEWTGPAGKGDTRKLVLSVRAPQHGIGKVKATVTFYRDGQPLLKRSAQYLLGAEENGAKGRAPEYELKKDSKGRDIIEY